MLSLLKRDMYLIQKNLLIVTAVILLISIPLLFIHHDIVILVVTIIPSVYFFMMYPCFVYDAKVKWNIEMGVMPIRKQTFVLSRYCLFGLLCILGVLVSMLVSIIFMNIFKGETLVEPTLLIMLGLLIPLLCGGSFIPCVYYFNSQHMELVFGLACFIPVQLLALLYKFFMNIMHDYGSFDLPFVICMLILIVLVFLIGSYVLSCIFYKKRWRIC